MNPDSKIEGRKKNIAICIACNWFVATVENVNPTARFAAMKSTLARESR